MTWKLEGIDDILNNVIKAGENARFELSDKYKNLIVIETIDPQFTKFKTRLKKSFKLVNVEEEDIKKIINHVSLNYQDFYPNSYDQYEILENDDNKPTQETSSETIIKISKEDWKITLINKYDIVKKTVTDTFPDIWPTIEFTLSSMMILHIERITLPFIGIILGQPSSAKTLVLELLRGTRHTYYTDSFTARAFVSHNSSITKTELKNIDLIPKIIDKLFMTPELGPTFSNKDEELVQTLGIITRLADGHGYESDTGALGHRGYNEPTMFVWIGAAVEIPRKVYKLLGTLGPKLYFFRIKISKKSDAELLEEIVRNDFKERRERVKEAILDYLSWFEKYPSEEPRKPNELLKVQWDSEKDEKKALECIVKLGRLLAALRGVTTTWETKESQGSDYAYTTPIIEHPSRAITSLTHMSKGHALTRGKNYLTFEDIPLIVNIALSTAPIERVKIFDLLLEMHGTLSAINVEKILKISKPTALKTMKELEILGIVDLERNSEAINAIQKCKLKEEFEWFLSFEFKALRQESVTSNNTNNVVAADITEVNISGFEDKNQPSDVQENQSIKKNYPHAENNFSADTCESDDKSGSDQSFRSESNKEQLGEST